LRLLKVTSSFSIAAAFTLSTYAWKILFISFTALIEIVIKNKDKVKIVNMNTMKHGEIFPPLNPSSVCAFEFI
jgi:hypothetical protein